MRSTKDLVLTQRSRTVFHSDVYAGCREFDSRVELVRATIPNRPLKDADLSRICLVSCRCKPPQKLHRTGYDNTEQNLAWESAIALTWKFPIRWEANP